MYSLHWIFCILHMFASHMCILHDPVSCRGTQKSTETPLVVQCRTSTAAAVIAFLGTTVYQRGNDVGGPVV